MMRNGEASKSKFWYNLFDLGVADVNDDNFIDLFTVHHSDPQSLLINDGTGEFASVLADLKLSQNPDFPGFEVMNKLKVGLDSPPGLYISRTNDAFPNLNEGGIRLDFHRIGSDEKISGIISLPYRVKIGREESVATEVKENISSSGLVQNSLEFYANNGAILEIYPAEDFFINTPISFRMSNQLSLDEINVGVNKIHPTSLEFDLILRDRHGMVWADFDGNEKVDLFITRGGLKGRLLDNAGIVNDELLIGAKNGFTDQAVQLGIMKKGCPGRQASSVDYNNDGRLDLYIACGRSGKGLSESEPGANYPNQLYQQQSSGNFIEVSQDLGLDIPENGSFVWVDADGDGDMDLFWQNEREFILYVNQTGSFESRIVGINNAKKIGKLSISDYDADGDMDIFAASDSGNALLINEDGKYAFVSPKQSGLPSKSLTANWGDYDNDGLTDLYTAPQGVYLQNSDRHFEESGALQKRPSKLLAEERSTWFDVNNDGALDLISASRYHVHRLAKVLNLPGSSSKRNWNITLYQNSKQARNHWLDVKLIGTERNRQAIGAKVVVETSDGKKQMQQVGQYEGSLYSQGHYRMYFGLGENSQIKDFKVIWPDGYLQEAKELKGDQLIVIHRNRDIP